MRGDNAGMRAPTFDAGAVSVSLIWCDGHARNVVVRVARPAATNLLCHRPAEEALHLLPTLYGICGAAQGLAARLALAAARGAAQAPAVDAAVLAEARREHLWRLSLDWPQMLGLPRLEALFLAGRRHFHHDELAAWAADALPGPCGLIEAAIAALPPLPAPQNAPLLPALSAAQTLDLWPRLDADFAAAPTYRGLPATTGALARHPELADKEPLTARVLARAADLATTSSGLGCASAATVAAGIGRAAVETARGLLLHEVVLDGERIADYVIVAPTEWNFHPAGMLHAWLDGAAAATQAELAAAAARLVLAFDPCVRSDIRVDGAAEERAD